ncbi:putative peptidase M3A/M3B catalytic domain, neurolysin/Thimet oligopeptidase, domain 2 [Plasmopara halstedii]
MLHYRRPCVSLISRLSARFQRNFGSAVTNSLEMCVLERRLPPFERLKLAEIVPAVTNAATDFKHDIHKLEKNLCNTSKSLHFNDVVDALEVQSDALNRMWGIVGHLMSVRNSEELRTIHDQLQHVVIQTLTEASQSKTIYNAYQTLRSSNEWSKLNVPQQRIIELSIRSATLNGVGLDGEDKNQFNKLKLRAAALSTKFSSNLLDATKAFSIIITDKNEIEGLPRSLLEMFAQSAQDDGHVDASANDGPWRVTLDPPSFVQFMKYSAKRSLRETLYRAYVTRASGDLFDNERIIVELLEIRQQIAKLLGFNSFAELSIAKKMAPSVEAVEKMHRDLREKCVRIAHDEVETVANYAKQHGQSETLAPWDLSFWSEKLKSEKYQFTDEEVKPYFPLERVLDGLFSLTSRLFAVTIEAADGQAEVWNADVRFFNVRSTESDKEVIAQFYLDPYSRPNEKNGGAWMNTCVDRSRLLGPVEKGGKRIPVAYIICNQAPPVGDTPSLMTFREVETLFHEFGHGLQHMLTQMEYADVAGINGIEWDAVEIPSQMMENFCYDKDTIAAISGHYKTGESLPNDLFEKLKASRNFMIATGMLRQLGLGALDMYLHSHYSFTHEPLFAAQQRLLAEYTVLSPLKDDRFLCSFAHIFAGGYAAGYYRCVMVSCNTNMIFTFIVFCSYKWAEILSCDAYGAFKEAATDGPQAVARVGLKFRETILARGGGQHPEQVFEAFRGRKPSMVPLLTQYDLVDK